MRILILIAIGLLLYIILTKRFRRHHSVDQVERRAAENMVRCEKCGLHIAEREAIKKGEHYFCSTQHLEAFLQSK